MTFPAYRHLLALEPALRLPAEAAQRQVQPVALVARAGERPIGLALAEVAVRRQDGSAELLSLFVEREHRQQGVATALLAAIEDDLRRRGEDAVEAVYMTGKPSIVAIERLFEKGGWERPTLRSVTVKFTIAEALSTPWYGRFPAPEGGEVFSWKDLTPAERQQIVDSNDRAPWIPVSLQPWRHDQVKFDEVSSVGLRYHGEVVGWVINHRVDERTVRFTCSFMRRDLARRARILTLYSEAVRRLSETGCQACTFITPTVYPEMVQFIHKHMAPYASFTGETRGTRKTLASAAPVGAAAP